MVFGGEVIVYCFFGGYIGGGVVVFWLVEVVYDLFWGVLFGGCCFVGFGVVVVVVVCVVVWYFCV